jgi:hypothetical protein
MHNLLENDVEFSTLVVQCEWGYIDRAAIAQLAMRDESGCAKSWHSINNLSTRNKSRKYQVIDYLTCQGLPTTPANLLSIASQIAHKELEYCVDRAPLPSSPEVSSTLSLRSTDPLGKHKRLTSRRSRHCGPHVVMTPWQEVFQSAYEGRMAVWLTASPTARNSRSSLTTLARPLVHQE